MPQLCLLSCLCSISLQRFVSCLSRKLSILNFIGYFIKMDPLPPCGLFKLTGLCLCSLFSRLTGNEPLSILPLNSLPEESMGRAHYKLCDRLKLEKKQRRMCRRDPGVAETLREAITMSALECQYQFRFERWNCTLEGRHRANILKRGMGRRKCPFRVNASTSLKLIFIPNFPFVSLCSLCFCRI